MSKLEKFGELEINMLGVSSSGKSMFMAGVFQTLVNFSVRSNLFSNISSKLVGLDIDSLTTEDRTGFVTARDAAKYEISKILDDGGTKDTLPPFCFGFKIIDNDENKSKLVPFVIRDYVGGLISDDISLSNGNTIKDDDQLKLKIAAEVAKGDVIIIMVDAIILAQYADNINQCFNKIQGIRITSLVSSILQKNESIGKRGVTILTVLTKTDSNLIDDSFKENGFKKLYDITQKVFINIYAEAEYYIKKYDYKFAIIPTTTTGYGKVKNEIRNGEVTYKIIDNNFSPYNIDLTVIYSVLCAVKSRIKQLGIDINKYESDIQSMDEKIKISKKALFDIKAHKKNRENMEDKKLQIQSKIDTRMSWIEELEEVASIIEKGYEKEFENNFFIFK